MLFRRKRKVPIEIQFLPENPKTENPFSGSSPIFPSFGETFQEGHLDEAKLELESAVKQVADAADLHELLQLGDENGGEVAKISKGMGSNPFFNGLIMI